MNTNPSIVDIIVHLHPACSCDDTNKIESYVRSLNGVFSVHFNEEAHPHALLVAYNPDAVTAQEILAEVHKCDSQAMMAGM